MKFIGHSSRVSKERLALKDIWYKQAFHSRKLHAAVNIALAACIIPEKQNPFRNPNSKIVEAVQPRESLLMFK